MAGPPIEWDRQDLNGFESTSIAKLAERYDLIVLDHPGLGAAASQSALVPLETCIPGVANPTWRDGYIGAAAGAYNIGGQQWAVPIDAATQVAVLGPTCSDYAIPTWDDVLELRSERWVIPTKSPHALLSFLGMCAAIQPNFRSTAAELVPWRTAEKAFELIVDLVIGMHSNYRDMDPITILDAIQAGDVDASPLLYGYVTYARSSLVNRLHFVDAPSYLDGGKPGSVLGGTGIALSTYSKNKAGAIAHLRQITGALAQTSIFPSADGQPAASAAWSSHEIDKEWGGFYSHTRRSQVEAWRRPRYAGWIQYQHQASRMILTAIDRRTPPNLLVAELNNVHAQFVRLSHAAGTDSNVRQV